MKRHHPCSSANAIKDEGGKPGQRRPRGWAVGWERRGSGKHGVHVDTRRAAERALGPQTAEREGGQPSGREPDEEWLGASTLWDLWRAPFRTLPRESIVPAQGVVVERLVG